MASQWMINLLLITLMGHKMHSNVWLAHVCIYVAQCSYLSACTVGFLLLFSERMGMLAKAGKEFCLDLKIIFSCVFGSM